MLNRNSFLIDQLINSIPAFKYIFTKKSSTIVKIFWILAITSSFLGLSYYIIGAYRKWKISPEIAMTSRLKWSGEVPFPAFTICSPYFPMELQFYRNPVIAMYLFQEGFLKARHFNSVRQNYLAACLHTCGPLFIADQLQELFSKRTDTNFLRLLWHAKNTSYLYSCKFRSRETHCKYVTNKILTDYGYCESFNMQGFHSIFNDIMHKEFNVYKRYQVAKFPHPIETFINDFVDDNNEDVTWTLASGYTKNNTDKVTPIRMLKKNIINIKSVASFEKLNLAHFCEEHGRGLTIFMHLPNEMPTPLHQQLFVTENHQTSFKVSAQSYKMSKKLKSHSPDKRQCYFEDERMLKFFKTYTKTLCDFECMTNYTFHQCGCVKFSMPRTSDTPVCDVDKAKCYFDAMRSWPTQQGDDESVLTLPCNCYPPCNDIKYSFIMENDAELDRIIGNSVKEEFTLEPESHVMEEIESYEVYTLLNFVADCGGLMGLFLGFSMLSLLDLFYSFGLALIKKKKIENSKCCHHCIQNQVENEQN